MLVSHERERLINAAIYFAENTKYIGKLKLLKLLYFLDFMHYKRVGYSVTGQNYYALPMGPVPTEFYAELDQPAPDLQSAFDIAEVQAAKGKMIKLKPKSKFDPSHFTRFQLRLMEQLAQEYRDARSEDMIEATHLENLPWHQVYEVEGRRNALIPYELAFDKAHAAEKQALAQENRAVERALQ